MIKLDCMLLGDCFTPEELVNEIFRQCPDIGLPIPVEDIAKAVGIVNITALPLSDVEGMLIADEGKSSGAIFFKESSILGRQRFTIGHELGHYLLLHHNGQQECLTTQISFSSNRNSQQILEDEANSFSQLLLMPKERIVAELTDSTPDLNKLKDISELFLMSFEPIANKCASYSSKPFSLVYSKDGIVRYCWRDWENFPYKIPLKKGDKMPENSLSNILSQPDQTISEIKEANTNDWLVPYRNMILPDTLQEQLYTQADGYQITLLSY